MGKYNFDAEINRRGTDSLKWDVADTELPMWVADMDFATAPEITQAVVDRARQGIYGYTTVPQRWYDAVGGWWRNRHGMDIPAEWLCFCTGVVPAISSMVKRLTNVGDNVLVQTPVYDIFFSLGRKLRQARFRKRACLRRRRIRYRLCRFGK